MQWRALTRLGLARIEVIGSSDGKAGSSGIALACGSKKWPSIDVIGSSGEMLGVMTPDVACTPPAPNHEGEVPEKAVREQSRDIPIMWTCRRGPILFALGHVARHVLA